MGYDLRKLRFCLFLNWSLFDIMIESRKFKLTNDFISIIFRIQWIPEKLSTFYWWGFNQTKQCEENVFDSWIIEIHFIPTNKTRVYFMILSCRISSVSDIVLKYFKILLHKNSTNDFRWFFWYSFEILPFHVTARCENANRWNACQ